MGASAVTVNIQSVRLIMNDIGFGTQRIEHCRSDHPAAAVGTIQCYFMVFERTCGKVGQVSDITVSACIEVNRTSNFVLSCKRKFFRFSVNIIFDCVLQFIVHLFAFSVHQLDSVVIVRIMAC